MCLRNITISSLTQSIDDHINGTDNQIRYRDRLTNPLTASISNVEVTFDNETVHENLNQTQELLIKLTIVN